MRSLIARQRQREVVVESTSPIANIRSAATRIASAPCCNDAPVQLRKVTVTSEEARVDQPAGTETTLVEAGE